MYSTRLAGWTIAETLVGMAIVFTLTGTVGFLGAQQIERARVTAAVSQVKILEIALESYALDTGDYPTREQGLDALYTAPVLAPLPRGWNGPYLQKPPGTDPWGGTYHYNRPGPDGLPYQVTYEGRSAGLGAPGAGLGISIGAGLGAPGVSIGAGPGGSRD